MWSIPIIIFFLIFFVLTVLTCYQESKKRQISFTIALLLCFFLTPIIGYIIIIHRPLRNPVICSNCGNRNNESTVCGVCGHNTALNDEQVADHLIE